MIQIGQWFVKQKQLLVGRVHGCKCQTLLESGGKTTDVSFRPFGKAKTRQGSVCHLFGVVVQFRTELQWKQDLIKHSVGKELCFHVLEQVGGNSCAIVVVQALYIVSANGDTAG
nr:hypothetical protein [Salidesulfovibrio brasiliensis]